jgi:hypothetical protein
MMVSVVVVIDVIILTFENIATEENMKICGQ